MNNAKKVYKLFVSNVPWTVSSRDLKVHFSKFGPVSTAHVIFDKNTGLSKGYGFVAFSSPKAVEAVINTSEQIFLEGNPLIVQPTQ